MCSDLQPPHCTAHAFGSTSHLPPAPKGFCYCSVIIDNSAAITCQNTADNCHSIQHIHTTLKTAVKGQPINIEHQGISSVLMFDHRGCPHQLCMGKVIIDPSLRNLCSPSAMLHYSDQVRSVTLSKDKSHLCLSTGHCIPLQHDGCLW